MLSSQYYVYMLDLFCPPYKSITFSVILFSIVFISFCFAVFIHFLNEHYATFSQVYFP